MPDKITKFIKSLNVKIRKRLKEKLIALKKSPYGMKGVKRMNTAEGNIYRLRMGDVRIIYKIDKSGGVEIIDIDYRGNIY